MARTGKLSDLRDNYPATTLDGSEIVEILQDQGGENNFGAAVTLFAAYFANPTTDDGDGLGTTSLKWSDLFLASGAVINFDSGDVTMTHSSNTLAFAGASSGYTFDAAPKPASNDGAALGASGTGWSDLFLASGGVINWNAGNVTLTHSSGVLTTNARWVITQTTGAAANSQIYLNCGSSGKPALRWDAQGGLTGMSFYSGTTEIARFQDNGACYFSGIGTLGGFDFGNFYIRRGTGGGRMNFNFGSPTFDFYSQGDASTTAFCRMRGITTTVPVLRLKAAASHSGYVQDWVDSSDTVMAGVRKNGAFKPASMADSAAENDSVYYSTDASKLVYKDSGGTVNALY